MSSQEDGAGRAATAGSFGESIDVAVLEVEAVVTDGQGHRVPGLQPEDFRLLVDGQEVPVKYFAEVRDGQAASVTNQQGTGQAGTTATMPEPSAPIATNYLVFIDDYFGIGARRNQMLDRITQQIDTLPPQDRVAVLAYDGERVQVLADWSSPRSDLRQVLLAAKERPSGGLLRSNEWQRRELAPERVAFSASAAALYTSAGPAPLPSRKQLGAPSLSDPTLTQSLVSGLVATTDRRLTDPFHDIWAQDLELSRELTAIQATLRLMPRPEGRRVLFLLAGGWPEGSSSNDVLRPGERASLLSLPRGYNRTAPLDDLAMIQPVIDTANLLGYTVYPADMNGFRPAPQTGEIYRQGTLRKLAEGTGGRALLFSARDSSLTQVVEDTRTYYSLGITPELARDDAYHDIRVEVRPSAGSGHLRVRARDGYRDFSRATELNVLTESALQFAGGPLESAAPAPTPGTLSVSLGTPQRRPRKTMKVPLAIDVPWSQITVLPANGGSAGHLEIRVAARDRDGALSEVATVPIKLTLADQKAPAGSLHWESDLLLRRERNDLVVSVYDALSGRVMTRVVSTAP